MPVWVISLFFAVGVAGFVYSKLARSTGNAQPGQVIGGAAIAGFIAFVVFFTLFKFTFGF